MDKKTKVFIDNLLKWLWVSLISVFIIYYFEKNFDKIFQVLTEVKLSDAFLCLFILFFVKFFLAQTLNLSLLFYDISLRFYKVYYIYNTSQLGKYIPGNFWHFVGKIGYLKKERLSNKKVRNVILFEIFSIISGSLIFGVIFILFNPFFINILRQLLLKYLPYVTIGLILGILLSFIFVIWKSDFFKKIIYKLLEKKNIVLKVFFFQFLIWIFQGLSFYQIANQYIFPSMILFTIGLYSLAYIIGFLFPLSPAGIGVREFIIVLGLLTINIPYEISVTLVTLHRVLYVVTEVLVVLLGFITIKTMQIYHKKKYKKKLP